MDFFFTNRNSCHTLPPCLRFSNRRSVITEVTYLLSITKKSLQSSRNGSPSFILHNLVIYVSLLTQIQSINVIHAFGAKGRMHFIHNCGFQLRNYCRYFKLALLSCQTYSSAITFHLAFGLCKSMINTSNRTLHLYHAPFVRILQTA